MSTIKGCRHAVLGTSDVARAREFYLEKIGLPLLEEIPAANLFACGIGGFRLSVFGGYEAAPPKGDRTAGMNLVFEVDDIEQALAELSARGVTFDGGIHEAPGFCRFIVTFDPDDNPVEFAQYLR
ncbi:MAG: VOC family protein [Bacteroidetes bacterium]|nr:VOC family protein [Bacteroidota bacterium]